MRKRCSTEFMVTCLGRSRHRTLGLWLKVMALHMQTQLSKRAPGMLLSPTEMGDLTLA